MAREPKTYDAKILSTEADEIDTAKKALAILAGMEIDIDLNEAAIRYARRALALYKDQARKASKLPASRLYTPDMSRVEDDKAIVRAAKELEEVAESFKVDAREVKRETRKAAPKAK